MRRSESEVERDEPLTPAGRLFLSPEMDQIIHCAIGCKNPIDVAALRSEIAASVMVKHPRFSSLVVRDRRGREHWRRTDIDVDRHVIVVSDPVGDPDSDSDEAVNYYAADLAVSSPLATDKPLWEFHILLAHNCILLRVHHALGDGISLMSMFLECCRRADGSDRRPSIGSVGTSERTDGGGRSRAWWRVSAAVWWTVVFVVEFVLRTLWVRDQRTAVSGGAGVELWPRKLATAKFRIDDMKAVKKTVANATINDVLFGVISSGLSRYLDIRSPKALREGLQITGVAMVNLRKQPGLQELSNLMSGNSGIRWGNKFGMLLLPVYYHQGGSDRLQYLKRAKAMIDQKKQSLEAHFSYKIGDLVMSCFGPKVACWLNYRIVCNTTFTISNVIGPKEEITIVGNPITYLRVNSSSLPHAITMHMVSYAGRADLQILVAKEIIPDPQVLAKCFEDALLEMKEAAEAATKE
ncbi:wax ester synthase/diacylglycerol acyltransferase 11-like isoform X1 [Actinidia eriantha]|uniref:wax ester synthase/diacylglycerol acyltransferase 11-like isoform X1 n=1 Tax=Actinidia eriantha TaxID=165200 RepID=UPI00258D6E3A|nr:wax ester synthase/diacylglycerol acyltransferase 11-like isoform X1 [Actinidia eriantha]XP_057494637.1 wax ester synthase/diacylglycerol acyltransferase 11-like isoform X1 [Actinidia eriantha]